MQHKRDSVSQQDTAQAVGQQQGYTWVEGNHLNLQQAAVDEKQQQAMRRAESSPAPMTNIHMTSLLATKTADAVTIKAVGITETSTADEQPVHSKRRAVVSPQNEPAAKRKSLMAPPAAKHNGPAAGPDASRQIAPSAAQTPNSKAADKAAWATPSKTTHSRRLGTSDGDYVAALATPASHATAAAMQAGAITDVDRPASSQAARYSAQASRQGLRSPFMAHQAAAAALDPILAYSGHPLLSNLPREKPPGLARRLSAGADQPQRLTPIADAAPAPKQLPLHVEAAMRDVATGNCLIQWFACWATALSACCICKCRSTNQPATVCRGTALRFPATIACLTDTNYYVSPHMHNGHLCCQRIL